MEKEKRHTIHGLYFQEYVGEAVNMMERWGNVYSASFSFKLMICRLVSRASLVLHAILGKNSFIPYS